MFYFFEQEILLILLQNLEMAKNLLSPSVSLGPENWNPTPGAEGLIDFSADFVKRDAVVEAFKVLAYAHSFVEFSNYFRSMRGWRMVRHSYCSMLC